MWSLLLLLKRIPVFFLKDWSFCPIYFQKGKVWEEVLQQEFGLEPEPDLAMASEQVVSTGVATYQIQMVLFGLVVVVVALVLLVVLILLFQFLALVLLVLLILVLLILVLLTLGRLGHPPFYAICDDFSF
jgi:predicted RND superfamily exporter protein